ncbi:MAG: UPF0104 family protein [Gemmatimonadales bacterium]|nr:MAG: UPF0104 family protein [Gemmatimonadales bacterium]
MNPAPGAGPGIPPDSSDPGPRPYRRLLRWAIQIILTVVVTWVIVRQVGVTLDEALSLRPAVPQPRPAILAASVLLLVAGFAASARLWGAMVRELGGPDPGLWGSFRIVMTANLGRYLPGKVWQVAGLAVLSRRAGISATLGTGAGVVGQAFHLTGALVVGSGAMAALVADAGWAARTGLGLLVLAALAASVPALIHRAFRLAYRLVGLDPGTAPRPGVWFGPRWIALHSGTWCLYGLSFWLFVVGLGLDLDPRVAVPVFSAAYLLGYLALFAPAGIGIREGVLIALLRPSLGVAAVGVAVLARLWMTIVELVPAGGLALWETFRTKNPETADGLERESHRK